MLQPILYEAKQLKYSQNPEQKGQYLMELGKKEVREKEVMCEILYMLQGVGTTIFPFNTGQNSYQLSQHIQMSHLATPTLRVWMKNMIALGNSLHYVRSTLPHLHTQTCPPLIQTFASAIYEYLKQGNMHISELLSQVQMIEESSRKLTLMSLWESVRQVYVGIDGVVKCVSGCAVKQGVKGQVATLLDAFWHISNQLTIYPAYQQHRIMKVFNTVMCQYVRMVKQWLKMSKFPHNSQFFILTAELEYTSEYFLHTSTQLQTQHLPIMWENEGVIILEVGKTIRFISSYYKNYEQHQLIQSFRIDEEFEALEQMFLSKESTIFKREKKVSLGLSHKLKQQKSRVFQPIQHEGDNPYEMFPTMGGNFTFHPLQKSNDYQEQKINEKQTTQMNYFVQIRNRLVQILGAINKICLKFFKDTEEQIWGQQRIRESIQNALSGIKKFMLCEQGDFIHEFLRVGEVVVESRRERVSHNKIQGYIEEAIKISSAKSLNQNMLSRIELGSIPVSEASNIRVWETLCFRYKVDDPMHYIFTSSMMEALGTINNLIICMKRSEYVLTRIWEQRRRDEPNYSIQVFGVSLQRVIASCLAHVLDSIERIWQQYRAAIQEALSVFEVVEESVKVVEQLKKSTVDNKLLRNGIIMGVSLVQEYRKHHALLTNPNIHYQPPSVESLQFKLKGIAELLMKVPELPPLINYNHFFDRIQ